MDTTITVDYEPIDQAEADRIEGWLRDLAGRYDLWEPDVNVRPASGRYSGVISLGSYAHKYEIDRLDTLARVLSRLLPGHDVSVEEEGDSDYGLWGERSTYNSGRLTRIGQREWVDHEVQEA